MRRTRRRKCPGEEKGPVHKHASPGNGTYQRDIITVQWLSQTLLYVNPVKNRGNLCIPCLPFQARSRPARHQRDKDTAKGAVILGKRSGPPFVVFSNQVFTLDNIVSTITYKNLTSRDWHTLVSMSSTARRDALRRVSISFSLTTAGSWDRY